MRQIVLGDESLEFEIDLLVCKRVLVRCLGNAWSESGAVNLSGATLRAPQIRLVAR
jgi:hypothetical protein